MKERKNIIQMRMEYYMLINLSPLEVRNITWEKMEASKKGL